MSGFLFVAFLSTAFLGLSATSQHHIRAEKFPIDNTLLFSHGDTSTSPETAGWLYGAHTVNGGSDTHKYEIDLGGLDY
jgi:hypothetical protein